MTQKFRAYLNIHKKIVDVQEINYKHKEIVWVDEKYTEVDNFEDVELLQSTGLKDKNGTEIFEGDILKENSMVGIVKFGRYLDYEYIQYGLDGWLFSEKLKLGFVDTPLTEYVLDPHCSIEVIGNIYEHPHLLEEE